MAQQTASGAARAAASRHAVAGPAATAGRCTLVQLILLEAAAAAVVIGLAARHAWLPVLMALGALLLAFAVVPLQRRWLYLVAGSWLGVLRRRRRLRRTGLWGTARTVTVPGAAGTSLGAIHDGRTWVVALELRLDGLFNEDAAVPVDALAGLLTIEEVPLADVRLLTYSAPGRTPGAPARTASRYLVLTLDTVAAAGAIAQRGGSDAAVNQILRRCVLRAEEVLGTARIRVRPLDEARLRTVVAESLAARPAEPAAETAAGARVGSVRSSTVVVDGRLEQALAELIRLEPGTTTLLVTALVISRRSPTAAPAGLLLVRLTSAGDDPDPARALSEALRRARLSVQRVSGEQVPLLRLTTPLGPA